MLSLKMSSFPSFCQDVHCKLSASLLQSMDSMIYMMIFERNLCVEQFFLCNINWLLKEMQGEHSVRYCVILSLLTQGSKLWEGPQGLHASEKCEPCGYVIIV